MSDFSDIEWQPITRLPNFRVSIDGVMEDTEEFHATLLEGRKRPHALYDTDLDRIEKLYHERLDLLAIYDEQFRRWLSSGIVPEQARMVQKLQAKVQDMRELVNATLTLAAELRAGNIDRILEMDDAEVGLMTLLGMTPAQWKKFKAEQEGE